MYIISKQECSPFYFSFIPLSYLYSTQLEFRVVVLNLPNAMIRLFHHSSSCCGDSKHKIILFLLHNFSFSAFRDYNVNICYVTPLSPQVKSHWCRFMLIQNSQRSTCFFCLSYAEIKGILRCIWLLFIFSVGD